MTDTPTSGTIGRNEPCPCGSGKKYKRCCGVNAAPKLSIPASTNALPGGMDPEALKSQFDPQMMTQFAQMMGRLPKGQLQKLQSIMQRAMAGKDVTREAKDFEHTLPTELQSLLSSFQMPTMPGMGGPTELPVTLERGTLEASMSEEEARKIVDEAAKAGKISTEEASSLLEANSNAQSQSGGLSKLWKKISGK